MPSSSSGVQPWQKRLYETYVSSGQARVTAETAEKVFASRRAYFTYLIREHFPKDRMARILDIGCGHGPFLYFLSAAGYRHLTGIDLSPEQVAVAAKLGITNVICGPAMDYMLSLAPESKDVIIIFDLLEHLCKQDIFDLLDQVYRVLSPGGICLIHVPNGEGLFSMRILFGDLTHRQAFTETSVRQMFSAVAFSEIQCFEDLPIVHGFTSAIRRCIWHLGTAPFRLLLAAETGELKTILSQNLVARATKGRSMMHGER